ncbi:MAG: class I SAM-dependent methyltransferase [Verrucomicrobiales bacterium]|nr:class I SAM-dependent methyltransferase [Verrucomicrobiales bacterium]
MTPSEILRRYYSLHSRIYDATRWSFLFGREHLLREWSGRISPARIVEIGCGTGVNLSRMGRLFPDARLVGIDTSAEMLAVARRRLRSLGNRVEWHERYYHSPGGLNPAPDLVCFSYCLSMINPGVEAVVAAVEADLAPGGYVAVVDFHGSRHRWFRHWMKMNHVRMEEHLLPLLQERFSCDQCRVDPAYGGLWNYFQFVGRARPAKSSKAALTRAACQVRPRLDRPPQADHFCGRDRA